MKKSVVSFSFSRFFLFSRTLPRVYFVRFLQEDMGFLFSSRSSNLASFLFLVLFGFLFFSLPSQGFFLFFLFQFFLFSFSFSFSLFFFFSCCSFSHPNKQTKIAFEEGFEDDFESQFEPTNQVSFSIHFLICYKCHFS